MLKPRKRLTKRQIKEDKLVTYYFTANEFLKQNSRLIGTGVFILIISVFVIFLYERNKQDKENQATVQLTKATAEYFQKNYESTVKLLTNLEENLGGTKSAKVATYYLANSYYQLKKYKEAKKFFRKYLERGGDDILEASALSGIAACYEEEGNYVEAAKTYKKAADKYSDGFMAPQNLYNAARCFALADNKEAASNLLSKLIEKYSNSNLKTPAEIFLAELSI
ncbi:MAG: tetratricopeptide repeat protein [bacterium]